MFHDLAVPAAEHFANFVYLFRERNVFFVIQRFCFPKKHKKYFQGIDFSDSQSDIRQFFRSYQEAGGGNCLNYFDQQGVDFLSQGKAVFFGQSFLIAIPFKIKLFGFGEQGDQLQTVRGGYY